MLFSEIALALAVAAGFGFVAYLLKQPAIVGFIAAGLLIGSIGGAQFGQSVTLESLASIGVTLLLFAVGLEMDLRQFRRVGGAAILTGLGQIAITFGLAFFILSRLGYGLIPAAYVAAALGFSSTIIVVKLLSNKGDLNSFYGRMTVGFLLVQDLVAVLTLIFLSGFAAGGTPTLASLFVIFGKTVLLFSLALVVSRVTPKLLHFIGAAPELLFLFSVTWPLVIAALVSSPLIGLSREIGGLLAGLALVNSSEHFQIAARVRPLRDFFIILFFLGLGAKLAATGLAVNLAQVFGFSLLVLIGKPLIALLIMSLLGFRAKTAFLASSAIGQTSEFSLILIALGLNLGQVSTVPAGLVAMVSVVTIFISSYVITYNNRIYKHLKNLLKVFEFFGGRREEISEAVDFSGHVILIGAHRLGGGILRALRAAGEKVVVVDLDYRIAEKLREKGEAVVLGDITDEEIQDLAGLRRAKAIISAIPAFDDNMVVLSAVREENSEAEVILTADTEWAAKEFYRAGADYVILPHCLGGEHLAEAIRKEKRGDLNLERLRESDRSFLEDNG
jgi:Kef-type K+ transport system membrane component KefB/voltage-gated potassium channel Kch